MIFRSPPNNHQFQENPRSKFLRITSNNLEILRKPQIKISNFSLLSSSSEVFSFKSQNHYLFVHKKTLFGTNMQQENPQRLRMTSEWSSESATNAYLDTLKLCNKHKEETNSAEAKEPESNEFISALAAGMNSQLIVEVTSEASPSTVALAAAARQTGGKLVCILPERKLDKSQRVIQDSGLKDMVDFQTGDPIDLLPNYENIDFSLVDCKTEDYPTLLNMLDVNPKRSVVVANNLMEGMDGLGGSLSKMERNKVNVRSMKHPIGKGMEVTMIGKSSEHGRRERVKSRSRGGERKGNMVKRGDKSKWVFRVDEKSGEEHIYRVPKTL